VTVVGQDLDDADPKADRGHERGDRQPILNREFVHRVIDTWRGYTANARITLFV
jgi:hypothetical protein